MKKDPRNVYMQTIIKMNMWYSLFSLLVILSEIPRQLHNDTFVFTFVLITVVEIIRLFLISQHKYGSVISVSASIILTIVPMLVLDFMWLKMVENRSIIDDIVIIGFIIFHIIEIFVGIFSLVNLSKFHSKFYQFHQDSYSDTELFEVSE